MPPIAILPPSFASLSAVADAMTKKKVTEIVDGAGASAGLVIIRKPRSTSGYYGVVRNGNKGWQARVYKPAKQCWDDDPRSMPGTMGLAVALVTYLHMGCIEIRIHTSQAMDNPTTRLVGSSTKHVPHLRGNAHNWSADPTSR
jgi:hypothetical protein